MARISPKNFTPIHAHESSRVENKRNVFLPLACSPLFLSRFLHWEGFYYGFLQDRALAESRAHPVTPTSLPAWIWDTVDRKKSNGHIIFWKEDTRDSGEHVRRERNEKRARAVQSTTSFSKIMRAITECEQTIIATLPQVQSSKQCDRDDKAVWFKSHVAL